MAFVGDGSISDIVLIYFILENVARLRGGGVPAASSRDTGPTMRQTAATIVLPWLLVLLQLLQPFGESSTSPGTGALDSLLGASFGQIIAVRQGSAARWEGYAASGLLDDRPRTVVRLPGVRGRDVPPEAVSLRARAELAHGREVHEGVGTLGALGCYASHVKAWRAVVASGAPRALIFEEDAVLSRDRVAQAGALAGLLADYVDTAGTGSSIVDGFDVALLGYLRLRGAVDTRKTEGWLRLRGAFWGTHAYLVTARGAAKLLAQAEPIAAQVDAYMGWLAEFDKEFVMLAAPESLIPQGGHSLDPPPPAAPTDRQESLSIAVQNRQCWKCDLDKYFPGGPIDGAASFLSRTTLALGIASVAGAAVAGVCGTRWFRRSARAAASALLRCLARLGVCKATSVDRHGKE